MNRVRALLVSLILGFSAGFAAAQNVSLTPVEVAINAFGSAQFTITVDQPAPAGGFVVSISAAPGASLQVPASVTINTGGTTATFSVTAIVASGEAQVTATLLSSTATATIVIGDVIPLQCSNAIADAKVAAQLYLSKLEPLLESCVRPGEACSAKVADAATTQQQLGKLQRAIKMSCTRAPRG